MVVEKKTEASLNWEFGAKIGRFKREINSQRHWKIGQSCPKQRNPDLKQLYGLLGAKLLLVLGWVISKQPPTKLGSSKNIQSYCWWEEIPNNHRLDGAKTPSQKKGGFQLPFPQLVSWSQISGCHQQLPWGTSRKWQCKLSARQRPGWPGVGFFGSLFTVEYSSNIIPWDTRKYGKIDVKTVNSQPICMDCFFSYV